MTLPMFPKPKDIKKEPVHVRVYRGGREVCNMLTKAGREEYRRRTRIAWEVQKGICPLCHLRLYWQDTTADHKESRGMGGGKRDDRQENIQAVHLLCNTKKGSRSWRQYEIRL